MQVTGKNTANGGQLALRRFDLFGTVTYRSDAPIALASAGFV
jgi:hypothetical protein